MKFLAYTLCYLFYPLSFLFVRSKKKMAFGSFRGSFNDNAKYLFIYVAEHHPERKAAWVSNNRDTVRLVRDMGLRAYYTFSLPGMWHALTSRYWFFNSYVSDIMYCFSGGAVCVNLWHGVGLKRCEYNITTGPLVKRYQKQDWYDVYTHPESFRRPDYLLTSTPSQTYMWAKAFRIPEDRCLEFGLPRNEILTADRETLMRFVQKYEPSSTVELIQRLQSYGKVFVYMPTWRDSQREIFTQSMNLDLLNQVLSERNEYLILKPHANVVLTSDRASYSNIMLFDSKMDIYAVLPFTHVLITDYSSIIYDYILMEGKDVILYLYDYDAYVKERDFFYPFDENVVGKRAVTFEELVDCIRSGDYRIDLVERQRIIDRFWGSTVSFDTNKAICDRF